MEVSWLIVSLLSYRDIAMKIRKAPSEYCAIKIPSVNSSMYGWLPCSDVSRTKDERHAPSSYTYIGSDTSALEIDCQSKKRFFSAWMDRKKHDETVIGLESPTGWWTASEQPTYSTRIQPWSMTRTALDLNHAGSRSTGRFALKWKTIAAENNAKLCSPKSNASFTSCDVG